MKHVKLVLGLIVLGLIGLFFYQNRAYFLTKHVLSLQIPFTQIYHLPELPNAILYLGCLLFGLLIAYFFTLLERFRAGKTIKGLKATLDKQITELSNLKAELASLKGDDAEDRNQPDDTSEGTEQTL